MYYDAHTHLNADQLYPQREKYLDAFIAIWGEGLINIWVNHERNQRGIDLARSCQEKYGDSFFMKAAIGIHPGEVAYGHITCDDGITKQIEQLKRLHDTHAQHIVAIGECGIDAHYDGYDSGKSLQQTLFHAQATLAKERNLPLVVHTRDQFSDTIDILKDFTDLKINLHCRWYTPDDIQTAHELFPHLRIWFCGNTTYKKAQQLRDSLKKIINISPLDKEGLEGIWKNDVNSLNFLLETDAPYLSPQQKRWITNEPAHLHLLYEAIAIELDIPLSTLQHLCKQQFFSLYT